MINPHRITVGLDLAKLFGKTADRKLGAVEPDLDDWEAGRSVPTPAQLRKLARLAGVDVSFFFLPDDCAPRLLVARVMLGARRRCELLVSLAEPLQICDLFDGTQDFEGAELVELPDGTFVPRVIGTV
jgi:transcriptional regulator with XRE-family HTH domain